MFCRTGERVVDGGGGGCAREQGIMLGNTVVVLRVDVVKLVAGAVFPRNACSVVINGEETAATIYNYFCCS